VSSRNVHWSEAAMKSSLQVEGGQSSLYFLEELQNSMPLKVMREAEQKNSGSDPITFFNDYQEAALAFRNGIWKQLFSPSLLETALGYIDEMIEHSNLGIDILLGLSPQVRNSLQRKRAHNAGDDADELAAADKEIPTPPTKKQRVDHYGIANNASTATGLHSAQIATSLALPLPQSTSIHGPVPVSRYGFGFLSSPGPSPTNTITTYVPHVPAAATQQSDAFEEPSYTHPQSVGTPGTPTLQQNNQLNVSNQFSNGYQLPPVSAHFTDPGLAQSSGFGVSSMSTPDGGAPVSWEDFAARTEGNELDEYNDAQDDYS
jgi:hypothetical protein